MLNYDTGLARLLLCRATGRQPFLMLLHERWRNGSCAPVPMRPVRLVKNDACSRLSGIPLLDLGRHLPAKA